MILEKNHFLKGEHFAWYLSFRKNILINSQYGPSLRHFGTKCLALPRNSPSYDFKQIASPFCALFSYMQNKRTVLGQEFANYRSSLPPLCIHLLTNRGFCVFKWLKKLIEEY